MQVMEEKKRGGEAGGVQAGGLQPGQAVQPFEGQLNLNGRLLSRSQASTWPLSLYPLVPLLWSNDSQM